MNDTQCPYCTNPELFRDIQLRESKPEDHMLIPRQGKFWQALESENRPYKIVPFSNEGDHFRITLYKGHPGTGKYFTDKFKHFKLDLIGLSVGHAPSAQGGNPFFLRDTRVEATLLGRVRYHSTPKETILFAGCRVRHDQSPIEIQAHWWHSHGTIIKVLGFEHDDPTNKGVKVLKDAMGFFEAETRGQPKFTELQLMKAIQKHGEGATQAKIAKELGVGDRTLRDWTTRMGVSWEGVKERYQKAEV